MTTQYIDLNCGNATTINHINNNSWTSQFNEGIELPTGTQVSIQSSFINKKGITGQSIEIEADIRETIVFNYYAVDTDYFTLIQEPQDPSSAINFDLFINYNEPINERQLYAQPVSGDGYANNSATGRSEVNLPLMNFVDTQDNEGAIIPMTGKVEIVIPKGTYSVSSLSDLITDQLQGIKLPNENDTNFVDYQKQNSKWTGVLSSFTTNRVVQAEEPWIPSNNNVPPDGPAASGETGEPFWKAYETYRNVPPSFNTRHFSDQFTYKGIISDTDFNYLKALDYTDTRILSVLAVEPSHYEEIRQQLTLSTNDTLASGIQTSDNMNIYEIITGGTTGTTIRFAMGFSAVRNNTISQYDIDYDTATSNYALAPPAGWINRNEVGSVKFAKLQQDFDSCTQMNYFDKGIIMGTDSPAFIYNASKSGFAIDRLHQPIKFPTNDKYGNEFTDRAGQEGFYLKRIPNGNFMEKSISVLFSDYDPANVDDFVASETFTELQNTLNTLMTRTSGISVFNWGLETAKRLRTKAPKNDYTDELLRFDEFFVNKAEAQEAWKQTLWGRLGFQYNQLQDPNSWGKSKIYTKPAFNNVGFTTETDADSSVITTISTLFNSFDANVPEKEPGGEATPKPKLDAGIQLFTQLDVNVPYGQFSNNKAAPGLNTVVAPYQGSYYSNAVMIPVISKTRQVVATELPTLSKFGYFLVSSDIVSQTDIANKNDPLSILDVIPITSLSNQDFIADRNEMIHTITNPKVLNSITIRVLNPDLSIPTLQPNSSVLLKITKPLPTPTEIQAEIIDNQTTQLIQKEVVAEEQQEMKNSEKGEKVKK